MMRLCGKRLLSLLLAALLLLGLTGCELDEMDAAPATQPRENLSTVPPQIVAAVTTAPPETTVPVTTAPPETTVPVTTAPPETTVPVTTAPPETTVPVTTAPPETTVPVTTAPPEPTETTAPAGIVFLSWPETVRRNEDATVVIQGQPGVKYRIAVYYSSGASTAAGLEPVTADSSGQASWTWHVGGRTKPGDFHIEVSGGGESASVPFSVIKD